MDRYDRTFLHRGRDVEDLNIGKDFLIAEKEKLSFSCRENSFAVISRFNQLENVTYRFTMLSF